MGVETVRSVLCVTSHWRPRSSFVLLVYRRASDVGVGRPTFRFIVLIFQRLKESGIEAFFNTVFVKLSCFEIVLSGNRIKVGYSSESVRNCACSHDMTKRTTFDA